MIDLVPVQLLLLATVVDLIWQDFLFPQNELSFFVNGMNEVLRPVRCFYHTQTRKCIGLLNMKA